MIKARLVSVLLIALFALSAHADNANSTQSLAGNWISESATGIFTQLEIADNGRFVLRQIHTSNLSRDYICGNLKDRGNELVLSVGAMKERTASGDISELVGQTTLTLDVVSRSDSQIVVNYKQRNIVLQLT